jgi:CRP-like cAMP-binding protein
MGCGSSHQSSEDSNHFTDINKSRQSNNTTANNTAKPAADMAQQNNNQKGSIMSQSVENPVYGAMLTKVPLLAKLTDQERAKLGGVLTEKKYNAGDNIIEEGEVGNGFFLIIRGECVVLKGSAEIARLKDGDFFGETALINNAKRGATVRAVGEVLTLYLERDHFDSLFGHSRLNVQFAKRKAISAETEEQQAHAANNYVTTMPANATKEKNAETTQLILSAIKDNVLFMNLDNEHKIQIIAEMYKTEINAGVSAVTQGALGDNLYVVESGQFSVFVNNKKVASRGAGSCFGELALMYNAPRAATVTAEVNSVVWVVDRFTFRRIVTNLSEKKFSLYISFLKKVDLLSPLVEYERKKVAEALDEVSASAGQTIFKQGDEGDAMYIIYSGEVKFLKAEGDEAESVEVGRHGVGEYFGERALLTSEPRAAAAVATVNTQLLKLDRNAFHLLLGPLEDIMKKKVQSYDERQESKAEPVRKAVSHKKEIDFKELKVIGTLGKGSFGFVQLMQDKSGFTYALKAVSKQQIVATGQQGHVMSEKRVMMLFDHPFLIKLYSTYKDTDRLYFLLEPSLGGELFSVLRERTLFDEETAKFYAASVILAFEYMHSLNIVYRGKT